MQTGSFCLPLSICLSTDTVVSVLQVTESLVYYKTKQGFGCTPVINNHAYIKYERFTVTCETIASTLLSYKVEAPMTIQTYLLANNRKQITKESKI